MMPRLEESQLESQLDPNRWRFFWPSDLALFFLSNCRQNCRSVTRVNRNRNRHRGGGGGGGGAGGGTTPPPLYPPLPPPRHGRSGTPALTWARTLRMMRQLTSPSGVPAAPSSALLPPALGTCWRLLISPPGPPRGASPTASWSGNPRRTSPWVATKRGFAYRFLEWQSTPDFPMGCHFCGIVWRGHVHGRCPASRMRAPSSSAAGRGSPPPPLGPQLNRFVLVLYLRPI